MKQLCRLFPTPRNLNTGHLFLLVDVVGLSISGPLGSDTGKLLEGAGLADGLESFESLHVISDGPGAGKRRKLNSDGSNDSEYESGEESEQDAEEAGRPVLRGSSPAPAQAGPPIWRSTCAASSSAAWTAS